MMASRVANNASRWRSPLSANLSRKRRCLRARPPMMASAYTYDANHVAVSATLRPILARSQCTKASLRGSLSSLLGDRAIYLVPSPMKP